MHFGVRRLVVVRPVVGAAVALVCLSLQLSPFISRM